jgi:hypothetical protein
MDDGTRVVQRTASVAIATAALALFAACGGPSRSSAGPGGSPSPGGSSSSRSAVAYSACMRSHGVPSFPDPGSDGAVPKADAQRLGVSSTQLQAAQQACQPLYPSAGGSFETQTNECMTTGDCPPALVQQILTVERSFAQCMRSHGLPGWPDPSLDSQGRPVFVISIGSDLNGVDPHEPQISSKEDECANLTGSPEPREVNP